MSKKRVKCFALLLCVSMCVIFGGCANVTYSLIKLDDNTLIQQVRVELDEEDINNHGTSISDIKSTIERSGREVLYSCNSQFEFYLIGLDGELASLLLNSVKGNYEWQGNTFILEIEFDTINQNGKYVPASNVYYFYYTGKFEPDEDDEEDDISKFVKGVFVNVYSETYTTTFDSALAESLENQYLTKYNNYTEDDVSYTYQYGQKYSRVHSDADRIVYQDGIYIHIWNLDSRDEQITLYRVYANTAIWYVIAVVAGLVVSIAVVIVCKIRKKSPNDDASFLTNQDVSNMNFNGV